MVSGFAFKFVADAISKSLAIIERMLYHVNWAQQQEVKNPLCAFQPVHLLSEHPWSVGVLRCLAKDCKGCS